MQREAVWDVERLLHWAYQNEAADAAARRAAVGPRGAGSMFGAAASYAALGTKIDGGGAGLVGSAFNPLAEDVHEVVVKLGDPLSVGLVISHAKAGTRPDIQHAGAVPVRVPRVDRRGRAVVRCGAPVYDLDPDPDLIRFEREIWQVWLSALNRVADHLNKMKLGIQVLRPNLSAAPWKGA